MKVIWKFPLSPTDDVVRMPKGAKILCVQKQDNVPTIWAEVDPDAALESRFFDTVPTGRGPDEDSEYIGTVVGIDGHLVFHVYEYRR